METLEFTLIVAAVAVLAGMLGALTGLGGGVVMAPVLAVALGVDIRYAIGASLVSVIATSSGSAAAYVKEGFSNIRLGMFLEVATTTGAVVGAYLTSRAPTTTIAIIFGVVLLYSGYQAAMARRETKADDKRDALGTRLRLDGEYPAQGGMRTYHVRAAPFGFGISFVAGVISGLLGIGGGAVKVLAMDRVMGVPFKVATSTSNFMIGVTAAAGAGVYLRNGYIDPGLAMPVMLGVLGGSWVGTRVFARARTKWLRLLFGGVLVILAVQLIYKGLTGRI